MMVYAERVREHFRFDRREITDLLLVSLFFGFLLSFKDWGFGEIADPKIGAINFVNGILVVFLSMTLTVMMQKLFALKVSHKVYFRAWYLGIAIGLYLGIVSSGSWLLLLPGGLLFRSVKLFKLGDKYEGHILHSSRAYIALIGPMTHMLLAYIFYTISNQGINNYLVDKAVSLNLILALITILPIPQIEAVFKFISNRLNYTVNLDGFYIFYHSRIFYLFALVFLLILGVLLYQVHVLFALLIAVILASTLTLFYVFAKEI